VSRQDSISILFKAKLFTVSDYGIGFKDEILNDIQNQKARFLMTTYSEFLFISIEFDQPYRVEGGMTTLIRNCNYYLAFDILGSQFYKLGGFDFVNIDSFFERLKRGEGIVSGYPIYNAEIEDVAIPCLYSY
jgi:hypothetical protein